MTIENLLKTNWPTREDTGWDKLDLETLLGSILGKERVYLHVHSKDEVPEDKIHRFMENLEKLRSGTPLHYLIGHKEWMGLDFQLTSDVLIPREDTRILLEEILALKDQVGEKPILLEIGTGSGILPVVIKKKWPEAEIHTSEIHHETLTVAKENFRRHQVQVTSYLSDFLDVFKEEHLQGDILFSNPPYIGEEEYQDLAELVRQEPYRALVGGPQGLDYYHRLAAEYFMVLKPGGYLCLEIGWKQGEIVKEILVKAGLIFRKISTDDGGRDRVLVFQAHD